MKSTFVVKLRNLLLLAWRKLAQALRPKPALVFAIQTPVAIPALTTTRRTIWAEEFRYHDHGSSISVPCPVCLVSNSCEYCWPRNKVEWTVEIRPLVGIDNLDQAVHYRELMDRYDMWEPFWQIRYGYTPKKVKRS